MLRLRLAIVVALCSAASAPGAEAAWAAPDLRADVNRDGALDAADTAGEDTAGVERGALFLANLDDDGARCRVRLGSDTLYGGEGRTARDRGLRLDRRLAQCHDASDGRVNGPRDALDLAPLSTVAMPDAGPDARAQIAVAPAALGKVRLFVARDGGWKPLVDGELTLGELRGGAQLALEGRDIVRDPERWDGTVTVALKVTRSGFDGEDRVVLRVAPVLFQHDLQAPQRLFGGRNAPRPTAADERRPAMTRRADVTFARGLQGAVGDAGLRADVLRIVGVNDPWLQDLFEPGWASVPGPQGVPQTMRVIVRSANFFGDRDGLRAAGRLAYAQLRGPDVAAVQQFTAARAMGVDDSLNSTGNFEALPPYRTDIAAFPRGRMVWGSTAARRPDPSFVRMLRAQGAQEPLVLDTSWLAVGHADETVHVVPAPNERGWTLMVADPRLAVGLLRAARDRGAGRAELFAGKRGYAPRDEGYKEGSSARSVSAILTDARLLGRNEQAAVRIDDQLATLLAETQLAASELVRVPVLFDATGEEPEIAARSAPDARDDTLRAFAYSPGIANGLTLDPRHFAAPDPHGPVVDGRDLFKAATEEALGVVGVRVSWLEEWDWLHMGGGEVHCGTNALRDLTSVSAWWRPPSLGAPGAVPPPLGSSASPPDS